MNIKKIVVGFLKTNCYLLINDNDCLIVDPGADYPIIKENIGSLNVCGILITHSHSDHIGSLNELQDEYHAKIYDYNSGIGHFNINNFSFDIIESKGHADDAVTFYFKREKVMFCGDFIFKGTIGRTDLPTGNAKEMRDSLIEIKKFPSKTKLFPGHGQDSTLGYELENNPYLKNL